MEINKKALGRRIKKIRVDKAKTTMEGFANLIDSGKSNVSRWERGENIPNDLTLSKIAKIGEISVEELLYGDLKNRVLSIFKETTEELKEKYPLITEQRFSFFFENIDSFYETTYHEVNKISIIDTDIIKEYYQYRFGRVFPFENKFKDLITKSNLLREVGYYNEDTPSALEYVINQLDEEEKKNLNSIVYQKAIEDTVNFLEGLVISYDKKSLRYSDLDVLNVLFNNINYHQGRELIRVVDKKSYIKYTKLKIDTLESVMKNKDISPTNKDVLSMLMKSELKMLDMIENN